ncbi:hypothetical protein NC653_004905 [Populus alba x Populus x berolinensis]|uniref:Peptidase C1A papain C-terminal domain-containing protein n=1 Tax=Populus alba x Populus x berolinensis TaxID=444605 RepID=A0AAD6RB08_9ROSI|nr:hypothetical protein NC653_004905 [Populus alba x Populus x berolinensis]
MASALYHGTLFLLVAALFTFHSQVIAVEPVSKLKLNSRILQVGEFKYLLGVKPTPGKELRGVPVVRHPKSMKLPKEFDARTAWPHCSTIGRILGQLLPGHCGSCWAFGAVESLSDRFCIHYGMNLSLSVNDLLACCGWMCGDGCDGGYPIDAWRYFVQSGVVTEECDPYFDDIGCSHPGCEPGFPTPKCERKCADKNKLWAESKHFSVNAYRIASDPHCIMAEVSMNGPVEDFAHYKSGVYKHITGDVMGGHAVKLIGWGTSDEGEDYWDGYFKIKRGTNECGIEEDVVAGLPSTRNHVREVAKIDAMSMLRHPIRRVKGGWSIFIRHRTTDGYFYLLFPSPDTNEEDEQMETSLCFSTLLLFLIGAIFTFQSQVIAVEPVSDLKLNSRILQIQYLKKSMEIPKAGWKATMNHHFSNYTVAQFKYLLGVKPTPKEELRGIPVISHPKSLRLPEEFDARTAWPQCSTIGKILGHFLSCFLIFMVVFMGHCGSCWAFGAVESLSDRFCIHYGMNISLSVNDLLACCGFLCGSGCNGGYPISAWRYFVHHGVVTEECDPYFDDIGCSHPGCEPGYPTPKCARKCVNKNQLWKKSKHYGVKHTELILIPTDFAHYKSESTST